VSASGGRSPDKPDVVDDVATPDPQLVLVKPAVNVMAKASFRLMNPNG